MMGSGIRSAGGKAPSSMQEELNDMARDRPGFRKSTL